MFSIKRVQPYLKEKNLNRLGEYLKDYDYYNKGMTRLVENQIETYTGRNRALLVNSATNALWMILRAIGISNGEVIFPNYGYPAIFKICHLLGLEARPVDIKEDTLSMNPEEVRKAVNGYTVAIVHIGSNGVVGSDIEEIRQIAKYQDMCTFIEDSAPSMIQEFKGKKAGTFGDVSVYSFSPTKPVTCGEGGVIVTDNDDLYKELLQFRSSSYHSNVPSLNLNMSPFLAAYLSPQLQENYLDEVINHRERIHGLYKEHGLKIFEEDGITNRYGAIMYLSENAEKISNKFNLYGIEHRYKYYPTYTGMPVSTKVRNNIMDLPSHFELNHKQISFICGLIRSIEEYD